MASTALVQHAPWGGDGGAGNPPSPAARSSLAQLTRVSGAWPWGAEETAYGVQCVDQWLYSPNGTAYTADLVYFQWGLHDGALKSKTLTAPLLRQPRSDLANRPLGLRLAG